MTNDLDQTICAPCTAVGGAVAIVRMSGPDALRIADRTVDFGGRGTCSEARGNSVKFGTIEGLDEVLVSVFRAPHSYTGEDSVEIGCHASPFIVSRLLELLTEAGARMAQPGEFTRRAFLNGKMDLAQAEAVADLIASSSEASHRVAMNQLKGAYSLELKDLRDQLVELTALMELELDFSEEDVEFADRSKLDEILDRSLSHIGRLVSSFRDGNALREGVPVAIVGAPNSGKSTLLNALVGDDRAIVSDIPGTTRDTVEEKMILDGLQYRFIDTAGLRETSDVVEKMGIERSLEAISKADIVIGVLDCSAPEKENTATMNLIAGKVDSSRQTLIVVSNKTDIRESDSPALKISAKTGEGLEDLRAEISKSQKDRFSGTETLITSRRHCDALKAAGKDLKRVQAGLSEGIPTDLISQDLRSAISSLNSIFGDSNEIDFKAVTDVIFSRFCIGK